MPVLASIFIITFLFDASCFKKMCACLIFQAIFSYHRLFPGIKASIFYFLINPMPFLHKANLFLLPQASELLILHQIFSFWIDSCWSQSLAMFVPPLVTFAPPLVMFVPPLIILIFLGSYWFLLWSCLSVLKISYYNSMFRNICLVQLVKRIRPQKSVAAGCRNWLCFWIDY